MALLTPRIQSWLFRKAPSRLQALFQEGKPTDWLASVPEPLVGVTKSHFERLRKLHPVSSVQMPDGSLVYWGAPREAINSIADQYTQPEVTVPPGKERRSGVRVPLACALSYETCSRASKMTGIGRIIDMSSSGVSFTTESLLRRNTRVGLHILWPTRFEGDLPVELFAGGKVVRADKTKTAIEYDHIAFKVAIP